MVARAGLGHDIVKAAQAGSRAVLELSMKLRDGRDGALALVAAIEADEREHECAREQREARARIQKKVLPFQPLPDNIQSLRLQFE